jgi:WD40 repeat protein
MRFAGREAHRIAIGNRYGEAMPNTASVVLLDANTLTACARFQEPFDLQGKSGEQHVDGLQFLDNEGLLTWGCHHSFSVWDVTTGKRTLPKDGAETPVGAVSFSSDNHAVIQVANRGKSPYRRWDTVTNEVREGPESDCPPPRVGLAADRAFLFTTEGGNTIGQLVELKSFNPISQWRATNDLVLYAISADAKLVAIPDQSWIAINGARTGETIHRAFTSPSSENAVAFARDNSCLFVGTHNGIRIHYWGERRGEGRIGGDPPPIVRPLMEPKLETENDFELQRQRQIEEQRQLQARGYHIRVDKLVISSDAKRLVSLGDDVRIWDVAAGRQCRIIPRQQSQQESGGLPLAIAPDNRRVAVGGALHDRRWPIGVFDIYSGRALQSLDGHLGTISALAFSHDGKLLASGSYDTTTLLWDVVTASRDALQAPKQLTDAELGRFWVRLSADDAMAAFEGLACLIDGPERSVPFAKTQLKDMWVVDRKIEELIANLDSPKFRVREAASSELAKLGWSVEPALRKALLKKPSAEVTARIDRLLAQLPDDWQLHVFASRVTEMLERIGTPEARSLLVELAKGPSKNYLNHEAIASLKRMRIASGER